MFPDNRPLIISTKLNRPRVPGDLVLRPQLFERLNRLRPLTLVIAPAGYGKSTLLSSWLDTLGEQPAAWLSLDEHNNDLSAFLSYFLAAIQTMFPLIGQETTALLANAATIPLQTLSATLINELDQIAEDYILVLDDYHLVQERGIHQLIIELLDFTPETLHLVIASRTDPPLPTVRYRAKNKVTEIRANDLLFSPAETDAFLRQSLGRPLDDQTVASIYNRSEGWVTGLRLELLSMRRFQTTELVVDGVSPGNVYVTEYLMLEALNSQSESIQEWLVKSAVLERFCAGLCDAVCASDEGSPVTAFNGAIFLEKLVTANLFIMPLDTSHTWFRYHHLLALFLKQLLHKRYTAAEIGRLHQKASDWLANNGFTEEAINHAIAADDMNRAAVLIEDNRHKLLNDDKLYVLKRWLDKLPLDLIQRRPKLLLAQVWVAYFQYNLAVILPILESIESLPDADLFDTAIKGELDFFWGYHLYWTGRGKQSWARLQKGWQRIPQEYALARATTEVFLALAQHMTGQMETAVKSLNQALYYTNDISDPSSVRTTRLLATLIFLYLLSGNLDTAEQVNRKLMQVSRQANNKYTTGWSFYIKAFIRLETNQLEAALDNYIKVLELRYYISADAVAEGLAGLALLYQAMGQDRQADDTIEQLQMLALEMNSAALLTTARSCQARLAVWRGDRETAVRWLHSADLSTGPGFTAFWLEIPHIKECRVLIAAGLTDDLALAAEKLARYLQENREVHNVMRQIELLILQTAVYLKQQRPEEAWAALEEAVRLGQPGGWIFSFLETGEALIPLLETLRRQNVYPDYIGRILDAIAPGNEQTQKRATAVSPFIEELTYRERDVLALLAQEMSNREIAERLVISPHTVKRHVASLSRKLDAKNRRQAVAKAAQLGLL